MSPPGKWLHDFIYGTFAGVDCPPEMLLPTLLLLAAVLYFALGTGGWLRRIRLHLQFFLSQPYYRLSARTRARLYRNPLVRFWVRNSKKVLFFGVFGFLTCGVLLSAARIVIPQRYSIYPRYIVYSDPDGAERYFDHEGNFLHRKQRVLLHDNVYQDVTTYADGREEVSNYRVYVYPGRTEIDYGKFRQILTRDEAWVERNPTATN